MRRPGSYQLQAAIAAVHDEAPSMDATDWRQIVGLYTALLAMTHSPVVELNRAVAVAMAERPDAGLRLVDVLAAEGELDGYHLLHAARADLLRRLGRRDEAAVAYARARDLAPNDPQRAFLERRRVEMGSPRVN